jgi:deoxyribonuclease V
LDAPAAELREGPVKAVVDVHYRSDSAIAACVAFCGWQDGQPTRLVRATVPAAERYRAGRFYERELPCVMAVLEQGGQEFDTIVIDGYVHLRPEVGKGLGVHLAESLGYSPVIIGVAKNPLQMAERFVPITRGRSAKPLFVSAVGCSLDYAARSIQGMHGPHRIPTILKLADQHARSA